MVKNGNAREGGFSQATYLEGLFSWQKWCPKPQNRAIFHAVPSVFQVVVLVRSQCNLDKLERLPKGKRSFVY
jgi:hypothetical protein